MATKKHRTDRHPDAKPLNPDTATARMLAKDKRVGKMRVDSDSVYIKLADGLRWGDTGALNVGWREFTLWETARNAVRKAVQIDA